MSPFPSIPGGPNPLILLVGLGERSSSPSGSGWSPPARRFLVHFRLKRTLLVIIIIKEVSYQSTCGIEPPTTFRLAVLKLCRVHLNNKLYLLVSAVDPQGSGVKCYMSPPGVTIHTGRMTVHTQLIVTL